MPAFQVKTKGHCDFIDITESVRKILVESRVEEGMALIFVPGSTAAITTIEFESGVLEDLKEVLEKIVPENADYRHHQRWGDQNGAAHIRSALIGTDLTVPINHGQLELGSWQQIALIDFDERPRERNIVVKIITE